MDDLKTGRHRRHRFWLAIHAVDRAAHPRAGRLRRSLRPTIAIPAQIKRHRPGRLSAVWRTQQRLRSGRASTSPRFCSRAIARSLGHLLWHAALDGRRWAGQSRRRANENTGPATISHKPLSPLFDGLEAELEVWMSHGDRIDRLPPGFCMLAQSDNSPLAAIGDLSRHRYGLQFHPEVRHSPCGRAILANFLFRICPLPAEMERGGFR